MLATRQFAQRSTALSAGRDDGCARNATTFYIAQAVPKTRECEIVLDVYYAWGLTRTIVTRNERVFDFDLNTCVVKYTTNAGRLDVRRAMEKFARVLVALEPTESRDQLFPNFHLEIARLFGIGKANTRHSADSLR
jgi:hypothetical protein